MNEQKDLIYEIAQETALHFKEYYDESKEKTDSFNQGFLSGLSIAYKCFRNRLLTYEDVDETELKKLGLAEELWNVDIEDFYK